MWVVSFSQRDNFLNKFKGQPGRMSALVSIALECVRLVDDDYRVF